MTRRVGPPRECTDCGQHFTGTNRRCWSCRATERTCGKCGDTFTSAGATTCSHCQAKDRNCTGCGRPIKSLGLRCAACTKIERSCIECGVTFLGNSKKCWACQRTSRDCTSCGRSFKSASSLRCESCQATERDCSLCGTTFTGVGRRCGLCKSKRRTCRDCQGSFKGVGRRCTRCVRALMPPSARTAQSRAYVGARRARQAEAQVCGPVPAAVYAAIIAGGACVYCGAAARHVDHVRPLFRGGWEIESNLVPTCAPCNLSKGSKLLTEWLPDRVAHGVVRSAKVAAEYDRLISDINSRSPGVPGLDRGLTLVALG